jgi:AraC-like DNA-binding protein
MKPIHKHPHDKNNFPFHIVYKDKKSPQHELSDHFHEWNEIIYIHSGNGSIFIDQTFYDLKEGDMIIIPTNTIHRVTPEKTNLILSTAIFFSPALIQRAAIGDPFVYLNIFVEAKRTKNYKHTLSPKNSIKLVEYIDQLMKEDQSHHEDRENALLLWLHLILLTIHRNFQEKDTVQSKQSEHAPQWMKDALTYINQHISEELHLQSIAERASISEAHFSRVFKQLIGMNLSNYITVRRILLAKERLLNSHLKIEIIAEQCGFNSMPHFYRTFKKQTTMTPSQFRKNTGS